MLGERRGHDSDSTRRPATRNGQNAKGVVPKSTVAAGRSRPSKRISAHLLVVDDNRLYGETLAGALRAQQWVRSVDVALDCPTALARSIEFPPTITLLNMATEDSLPWLEAFARSRGRVVCIGVRERESEIVACAEAGAAGYVLRDDSLEALRDVVEGVLSDKLPCSPAVAAALLRRVTTLAGERGGQQAVNRLTTRETEVLRLIEQGFANREIAARLCIELRTVKNHVHRILEKLDVDRRGQAAALLRNGRLPVGH